MKTISLSDDDLIELRILRMRLELEFESEKRKADKHAILQFSRSHFWSRMTTDAERNAIKAVDVLTRILK